MSPPVTDQLEERRKQRQARAAVGAEGTAARPQTPDAARDLLNGLITGSDTDEPAPSDGATDPGTSARSVPARAGEHEAELTHGEDVQDLVRRVQQDAAERSREAAAAAPRRAPSTVDLPPSGGGRRRRIHRSAQDVTATSISWPERRVRRWVVAAIVGAAATAILLDLALHELGGGTTPTPVRLSTSGAALSTAQHNQLGDALSATIGAIAPELRALAGAVPAAKRGPQGQNRRTQRHVNRHVARPAQHHSAAVSDQTNAVKQSPPAPSAPAPRTYTPDSATSSSASHTSASPQTPATSRSQPAGPTNSDPLGGLGSCVSGCT